MNEREMIQKAFSGLHASENTIEEVLKKADERKRRGNICYVRKPILIGLILVIVCSLVSCTAAVISWDGFAFTENLGAAQKKELMQSASTAIAGQYIDAAGSVHYLDENGKEIMVLSQAEAEAYEREEILAKEQAVIESITRVDASTIMPSVPSGITEVAVRSDGSFADFALDNGYMVLLYPEGEESFTLKEGDVVTITLELEKEGILEFDQFKDGVFEEGTIVSAKSHQYTFTVPEDGAYCFSITYCSATAGLFTDGTLTVG